MYIPAVERSLPVASSPIAEVYPASTDVELRSDGKAVRGWWLRSDEHTRRPLVILYHGNAGNRAGRVGWYDLLHSAGCDVLAIDYQGYGDSEGRPSQAAVETDAEATWDYAVKTLEYGPERVVVMGVSLGGAAAVHVVAKESANGAAPAGLITVAAFSSMVDVAAAHYPWLPVRAVLLDRYPSAEKMPHVTAPILHLHGDQDRIVEERFGRQLFEVAPETSSRGTPKRWVTLEDTGHNDLLYRHGPLILREIQSFVESAVVPLAVQ